MNLIDTGIIRISQKLLGKRRAVKRQDKIGNNI